MPDHEQSASATTAPTERPTERVRAYPPDAVLTVAEVAAWLCVSERQVYRLPIKRIALGTQLTRYLARHVYQYLEEIAA